MKNLRNTPVFNFTVSLLVLVFSTISPLFFSGASASALELGRTGFTNWDTSNSRIYLKNPTDYFALNTSDGQGGVYRALANASGGTLDYFRLCPTGSIPANSLFTFSLTAKLSNAYTNVPLTGGSDQTLLNSSYDGQHGISTYTYYTSALIDECIWFPVSSPETSGILNFVGSTLLSVSRPTYVVITDSGSEDYSTQLNQIRYLQQDQYNRLVDIISNLDENNQDLEDIIAAVQSSSTATVNAVNNLRGDVQAQTEQQHEDYENEVQREEDKQDELEDQADDVNISANAITNPFSSLFTSPNCASLPTLASWLNVSANKIQVCSPYPQQFRPIIEFVSSAIVVGLLIRVYYKQLKGGFAS